MRAEDDSGFFLQQILDRLEGGDNALVVGDAAGVVLRDIEVTADDYLFASYVDVFHALFVVLHIHSPL